ncbi:MAG: ATP-binding cassette domain-containing protein [Oligoflexales bacterium]
MNLSKKSRDLVRGFRILTGPKGLSSFFVGILASIGMVGVEAMVTLAIQLLFVRWRFIEMDKVPGNWIAHYPFWSTDAGVFYLLILLGLARGTCYFFIHTSGAHVREIILGRLKVFMLRELLSRRVRPTAIAASEANYWLSDVFPKGAEVAHHLNQLVTTGIQVIIFTAIMLWLSWKEALVGIAGLGIAGIIILRINYFVRKTSQFITRAHKHLNYGVERVARNYLYIMVSRTENQEYDTLSKHIDECKVRATKAENLHNLASALPNVLGIALIALIVYLSNRYFGTQPTALISFVYFFSRFAQHIATGSLHYGLLNTKVPQFLKAVELITNVRSEDLRIGSRLALADQVNVATSATSPPSIKLKNLGYTWPGEKNHIFSDITIQVEKGQTLAILGPSGAGKSTLLMLILGMIESSEGEIFIDSVRASEQFLNSGLKIGYVGPEPFLIEGTIRENLMYGIEREVRDDQVWATLEKVALKEEIQRMRFGLNHKIDEDGRGLSAGQKQRLCIARSLLTNCTLLILDEATANLDSLTERIVINSLSHLKGKVTIILVSHKPQLLELVDTSIHLTKKDSNI